MFVFNSVGVFSISLVKSSTSLEKKAFSELRRHRRCERSHSATVRPLEPHANGFHNVDATVCRRLSQNSPRHTAGDSARQMDSRSDSRDSGLGKESEIDYDRLLSLRNGHVNPGALDGDVSGPRSLVNRSLRFSQRHPLTPLTLGESFPWQLSLRSQIGSAFDERSGETFGRKSFDKHSLDDEFPQLSDRPTSPVSMFHENIQPGQQSTFHRASNHDVPSEHTLSTFRLSQNEVRDSRADLNGFLGSNSLGNYLQMKCHQTWASNQQSAVDPSVVVGRGAVPSQVPDFSVGNNLRRTNAKQLGREHFPNTKIFNAAAWHSYTGAPPQGPYDQKARYLTSTDPQPTSCPSPNSRLGFEPGFSASYFNRPSSRGFTQNVQFESYPAHYFGGSPAFQSISSNHRIKGQASHQGFGYCQNGFPDHTLVRNAADGLFFGPLGQR